MLEWVTGSGIEIHFPLPSASATPRADVGPRARPSTSHGGGSKIMMSNGFHLRTRPRMYLVVTLMCGMSALLLQFMLSGASQFKNYAELRLESAVQGAVHTEISEVARDRR